VAGVAGILSILASRRRADVTVAVVLAAAAAVGGTPGWYAFLAGFFGRMWLQARTAARAVEPSSRERSGIRA
jgi:hypothetical protein